MSGTLPGARLEARKMPGHWLLARLGKQVLRPGGVELSRRLLTALDVRSSDKVVELAPGLGHTAQRVLGRRPQAYTGVDREEAVVRLLERRFGGGIARFVHAGAELTGLPSGGATVVIGEAMLSMQTAPQKRLIVGETARLLACGGRYGIHELCYIRPPERRQEVEKDLSSEIHVGVGLLTPKEWRTLLGEAGLEVVFEEYEPMALLEPKRLLHDEGWLRCAKIAWNALCDGEARRRALAMRRIFHRHAPTLAAVAMIARKASERE